MAESAKMYKEAAAMIANALNPGQNSAVDLHQLSLSESADPSKNEVLDDLAKSLGNAN